jgi:uncharacterized glyoxalase superfamily protein PhnB
MTTKGAATVFHVESVERALAFYVGTLGFTERFRFGDYYAGVEYGEVQIHLSADNTRVPAGKAQLYIFCDEVDGYFAEIMARGATADYEPKDWPYGMRDFGTVDPDGNLLAFGVALAEDA